MSYLIPTWEISIDNKEKFRRDLVEVAISKAEAQRIGKSRYELFVKELTPSHLGLESWVTPKQLPHTTLTWINYQSDCDKILSFYKVVQLNEDPGIISITIQTGKGLISHHNIGQLYGLVPTLKKIKETNNWDLLQVQYGLENLRMEGWFSEPYVIENSETIKIDVTTGAKGTDGDTLLLIGFVVEPLKMTI